MLAYIPAPWIRHGYPKRPPWPAPCGWCPPNSSVDPKAWVVTRATRATRASAAADCRHRRLGTIAWESPGGNKVIGDTQKKLLG